MFIKTTLKDSNKVKRFRNYDCIKIQSVSAFPDITKVADF